MAAYRTWLQQSDRLRELARSDVTQNAQWQRERLQAYQWLETTAYGRTLIDDWMLRLLVDPKDANEAGQQSMVRLLLEQLRNAEAALLALEMRDVPYDRAPD